MTSTPKTEKCGQEVELPGSGGWGETGSGHRGSLRGANKLAKRARSFKEDLLERINNMRSPAQAHHAPHLSPGFRSQSPHGPKLRNASASDEGEFTPAKKLKGQAKEVEVALKHLGDVITKKKLEMLQGNGTIILETIVNIYREVKPYASRSPALGSAVTRLCAALACLIRLCDEATAAGLLPDGEAAAEAPALQPAHVQSVVSGLSRAVQEVTSLALQHMTRPALAPRPATAQRNSLPDIPLTKEERSLLTGEAGAEGGGVRASHSSESVLDAPDPPPPKPPRPHQTITRDLAPPLPPKRKSANDSVHLSIDRVSLQSHSSGSLDSMLNVSNDEEIRAIMEAAAHDDSYHHAATSEHAATCSCAGGDSRSSFESAGHNDSHTQNAHIHTNHNRFSSESGFASMGQSSSIWAECSKLSGGHAESHEHVLAAAYSQHFSANSNSASESTDGIQTELRTSSQSFERRMNVVNSFTSSSVLDAKLGLLSTRVGEETNSPPALPAKTRPRNPRVDIQQHFPNVEIRQTSGCALHGDRPHTLADHHPARPPPLPLKKKHIMAYMEMFSKFSHQPNAELGSSDMFRHSIHTYNLTSGQQGLGGGLQRSQLQQRALQQSLTLQHLSTPPLSGSDESVSLTSTVSGISPVPPEPPALPPKMNKVKQLQPSLIAEPSPPSPRPPSLNSTGDEAMLNSIGSEDRYVSSPRPGKFPLEDELDRLVQPSISPAPPDPDMEPKNHVENGQAEPLDDETDIILQTDVSEWLLTKPPEEDGPDIRGGHPDALIVLATKATKEFAYQEAFLATYRTWVNPRTLVTRLVRRARHLRTHPQHMRQTLALLTRVVHDLTMADLDGPLLQEIMNFVYYLVDVEELTFAKAVRVVLIEKQKQLTPLQLAMKNASNAQKEGNGYSPAGVDLCLKPGTLLDYKAVELAEQMTLLDAELFTRITGAEVLSWPRDQSEETSPNLTRFTEHFNKMSYWARSRILNQEDPLKRDKYAYKFLKVMKELRKMNNFNSYLALLSALDCGPVRRLFCKRDFLNQLNDHCALIDSSSSFRAYRQALAETQPPCIPYIGLVLQDLTFVHIGNPDHLPDGSINFSKRWQQYHIMENMNRFYKGQYTFRKNLKVIAMFDGFDDVLTEDQMWQLSESYKPRGGNTRAAQPAPAPT